MTAPACCCGGCAGLPAPWAAAANSPNCVAEWPTALKAYLEAVIRLARRKIVSSAARQYVLSLTKSCILFIYCRFRKLFRIVAGQTGELNLVYSDQGPTLPVADAPQLVPGMVQRLLPRYKRDSSLLELHVVGAWRLLWLL